MSNKTVIDDLSTYPDQLATDQVRLVRAAMALMRWAFTGGQCGALAGGLEGA